MQVVHHYNTDLILKNQHWKKFGFLTQKAIKIILF